MKDIESPSALRNCYPESIMCTSGLMKKDRSKNNWQKEHLELNYLFMKPPVVEALLNICNL